MTQFRCVVPRPGSQPGPHIVTRGRPHPSRCKPQCAPLARLYFSHPAFCESVSDGKHGGKRPPLPRNPGPRGTPSSALLLPNKRCCGGGVQNLTHLKKQTYRLRAMLMTAFVATAACTLFLACLAQAEVRERINEVWTREQEVNPGLHITAGLSDLLHSAGQRAGAHHPCASAVFILVPRGPERCPSASSRIPLVRTAMPPPSPWSRRNHGTMSSFL